MNEEIRSAPEGARDRCSVRLFALVSALLAIAAYGLIAPALGAYGDDPNFLWAYHRGGAAEFRPFMGWVREYGVLLYEWVSPFFKESILAWRLACLALRWLSALLYFATLRRAFPARATVLFIAGLLFLLYPGFSQQAIPVEFILHFFSLCCILASIALHQGAVRNGKTVRAGLGMAAAAALSLAGVFSCEYFIGLEIVRPVLIYFSLPPERPKKDRARTALLTSVPSLLILGLFFYWRLFRTSITYLEPVLLNDLRAGPLRAGLTIAMNAFRDLRLTLVSAFGPIFDLEPRGSSGKITLALILGCAVSVWAFIRKADSDHGAEAAESETRERRTLAALGLTAALIGGIPVWGAGLELTLTLFWDRLTLSFMWGVCLAAAAVITEVFRRRYRPVVLALLVALSLGYQFRLQNRFRRDWRLVETTVWELKWRAPDLEAGTLLLFDELPVESLTDNSLNALINWTYETIGDPARESYKVFDIDNRRELLLSLEADTPIVHDAYRGKLANALILRKTPSSCLTILRPADRDFPGLSKTARALVSYSDPAARIIAVPRRPMGFSPLVGPEPVHGWCSFYQRIEAVADRSDWDEILRLAREAESSGFAPESAVELRSVFIAALIRDDLDSAEKIAALALAEDGVPAYYRNALLGLADSGLSAAARTLKKRLVHAAE